jgi:hypothetical protein
MDRMHHRGPRQDSQDCSTSAKEKTGVFGMAYFTFEQESGQEFVFELRDQEKVDHARRIISGEETERVHVVGRIIKRKAPYNPRWEYYLDSNTISFFAYAIEVCDANMQYVDDHLDEACGAFLPGCMWCPWNSRVVREVENP